MGGFYHPPDSLRPAMTRLSSYLLPTEKQPPADAEALSHKLAVRAGLARQLGAGLWTYLPAGWRGHEKVVQIVREEIDAIGGGGEVVAGLPPPPPWARPGRPENDEAVQRHHPQGAGKGG